MMPGFQGTGAISASGQYPACFVPWQLTADSETFHIPWLWRKMLERQHMKYMQNRIYVSIYKSKKLSLTHGRL